MYVNVCMDVYLLGAVLMGREERECESERGGWMKEEVKGVEADKLRHFRNRI